MVILLLKGETDFVFGKQQYHVFCEVWCGGLTKVLKKIKIEDVRINKPSMVKKKAKKKKRGCCK